MKKENKNKKKPLQSNFDDLEKFMDYLEKKKHCQPNSLEVYEHYAKKMLEWADNKYLYNAWKYKKAFPVFLDELRKEDGSEYDQNYINGACSFARRFFEFSIKYLSNYDSKKISDIIDDFSPIGKKEEADDIEYYTREEMQKVAVLKPENIFEFRTIASFLFLFLSNLRIAAFLTMPIKAYDISKGIVYQNPNEGTYTKRKRYITTTLLDDPIIKKPVLEWDSLVRNNCPPESTWYARMTQTGNFNPKKIENTNRMDIRCSRIARSNVRYLMRSWKKICQKAGIRYLSPHKERYGNIHEWMPYANSFEQKKAIADNNGHTVSTLERIYARLDKKEKNSVMNGMMDAMKNKNKDILQKPEITSKQNDSCDKVITSDILNSLPDNTRAAIELILKGSGIEI